MVVTGTTEAKRSPFGRLFAGDIRALRKARGLTLSAIADRLDRSVGWLSQVERGLSIPTLADLRAFAETFKVPLSLFLPAEAEAIPEEEHGTIVRAGSRRSLGTSESGRVEELLSPDLGGSYAMLRSEFAAGSELEASTLRQSEEAGFVVSGRFDIEIDGIWHRLGEGDSFRFKAKPFRWRNPGKSPAVVVWVTSPPVY
jgi:transcriptional regulator with XRE-family HTH domain